MPHTTLGALFDSYESVSSAPIMLEIQPGRFALMDTAELMDVQPDAVAAGVFVSAPAHPSGLSFGARVLVLRLTPNEATLPEPAPYAHSKDWTTRDRSGGDTFKPWDDGDGPPDKNTEVRVTLVDGSHSTGPAAAFNWSNKPDTYRRITKLEWAGPLPVMAPAPAPPVSSAPYAHSKNWSALDRTTGEIVRPWEEAGGPADEATVVRVTFDNAGDQIGRADSFRWDNAPAKPFRIVKLEWN